jgi:hypothetical protein
MGWKIKKKPISKGKCVFCEQVIAKSGMRAHLESCKARKTFVAAINNSVGAKTTPFFQLAIEGADNPEYWMHLEIPATHTLADLDEYLRDVWLECCGHLSQFIIGDTFYMGHPDEDMFYEEGQEEGFNPLVDELPPDTPKELREMLDNFKQMFNSMPEELRSGLENVEEKDMKVPLVEVLKPGMRFAHEYDFGTTTALNLTVVSKYDGKLPKSDDDPIHLLARNEAPEIMCEVCGKPATLVCTECIWGGEGWVCNEHATSHHVDMLLPVVNSPRVGMCGYTGDAAEGWDFWADDPAFYQGEDEWDEDDEA